MTDEQFDDLARQALAFDAGLHREAAWDRVKPVRWSWLPTPKEISLCGIACAVALLFVGLRNEAIFVRPTSDNALVERALRTEPSSVLVAVTTVAEAPDLSELGSRKR